MVKDTGNTEDKEEAEETDLLAAKVIDNEEIKLKSDDVNELSDEDDDDRYTSDACKQTLARDGYFKLANWQTEWIEEAIRLTCEMWESKYKPPPHPSTTQQPNTGPQV
ncbi:hypothetical protein PCANC_00584 [Puccinia coronata f. sp. avenae]|uniref:Uncharacterized protein n=1 Tax=Puccinia coronata f. sp. avenae TaxID=200324 RepID=A0A2N5W857_9BASI|nr:hypothetical protein PCANC_00584 [Puccinia coronata f. sp. avenae]